MTRYLHTMYRITDPEKSGGFYEALGFEFRRELPIVRNGELEATNYFFGVPGQDEELELTLNHDGRTYDLGTGYGHIALAVDDLAATLEPVHGRGPVEERDTLEVVEAHRGARPPSSYLPLRSISSTRYSSGSRTKQIRDPPSRTRYGSRSGSIPWPLSCASVESRSSTASAMWP